MPVSCRIYSSVRLFTRVLMHRSISERSFCSDRVNACETEGFCLSSGACFLYDDVGCLEVESRQSYYREKGYEPFGGGRYLFGTDIVVYEGCGKKDGCTVQIEGEPCKSCKLCGDGKGSIIADCSNLSQYVASSDKCIVLQKDAYLVPQPELGKSCKELGQNCKIDPHCCDDMTCENGACQ